eukprot:COSAG06_NODE_7531_length_2469_cov_4.845992_3_plen_67_part_00
MAQRYAFYRLSHRDDTRELLVDAPDLAVARADKVAAEWIRRRQSGALLKTQKQAQNAGHLRKTYCF